MFVKNTFSCMRLIYCPRILPLLCKYPQTIGTFLKHCWIWYDWRISTSGSGWLLYDRPGEVCITVQEQVPMGVWELTCLLQGASCQFQTLTLTHSILQRQVVCDNPDYYSKVRERECTPESQQNLLTLSLFCSDSAWEACLSMLSILLEHCSFVFTIFCQACDSKV